MANATTTSMTSCFEMESLQQEINRFESLNKQLTEVINTVKKIEDLKVRKIIRDQLNMIDGKRFDSPVDLD